MRSLLFLVSLNVLCVCWGFPNGEHHEKKDNGTLKENGTETSCNESSKGISTFFVHYGYTRSEPGREIDTLNCTTKSPTKERSSCPEWLMNHLTLEYEQFQNEMEDMDSEVYAVYYTQMFTMTKTEIGATLQKERLLFVSSSNMSKNGTIVSLDLNNPYEDFHLDFLSNNNPLFDTDSEIFRLTFENPENEGFKHINRKCHPNVDCDDDDILALEKLGLEAAKNSSNWMKVVVGTSGLKGSIQLGVGKGHKDDSVTYAMFEVIEEGKLQEDWSIDSMKANIMEMDNQWIKTCKCALNNTEDIPVEKLAEKCFMEQGTREDLRKILDILNCPKSWSSREEN